MDPDAITAFAAHVLLVLFRVSGLCLFAPLLSSPMVPVRVKVIVCSALALAIAPLTPPPVLPGDLAGLGLAIAGEVFYGMCVGILAALPIWCVQLAGMIMSIQIGLALAAVYNPAVDSESDTLAELLLTIAIAVFLAMGGLEITLLALARTFEGVPPGAVGLGINPAEVFVSLLGSGFELALRLGAPVTGVILLETVAAGVLSKTMPQLNILSIGFAIKIMLGLGVLMVSLTALHQAIEHDLITALGSMYRWAEGPHAVANR